MLDLYDLGNDPFNCKSARYIPLEGSPQLHAHSISVTKAFATRYALPKYRVLNFHVKWLSVIGKMPCEVGNERGLLDV